MEVVEKRSAVGPVMSPSLVVQPNFLVPTEDRRAYFAHFLPGETLGAYIERVGVALPSRVVQVEHNGRVVPAALWRRLIPRLGDQVVIRSRPLGGGGGNKILRTVAMIAIIVVAAVTQQWYAANGAGFLGLSAASSASVLGAGIMVGGSLLVNALLPAISPTAAKLGTGEKYESSPTYAISGGRNRARPYEPMLLVFGRHKVVPDYGATPYAVYSGNDQYFNQVFHFGLQGTSLQLTDLRVGETLIENYQDVQTERSGTDGKLSSFPGNVDTLQGFVLNQVDGWNTRQTADGVYSISVNLAARLFKVEDDGSFAVRSVVVRIQYRKVGATDWIERSSIGAVYATHYWSLVDRATGQQVLFGSTAGNEHQEGDTFVYDPVLAVESFGQAGVGVWRWVPHPNALGRPWVGLAPDPLVSAAQPGLRLSGAAQEVARATVSWVVEPGAYEVRVMKVTADINDSRESNETAVAQILAYQEDLADYTGQARLGITIKATGQLSGALDEVSAIAQGLVPVWTGTEWITQATSNPAWWYLWFARGKRDATGNRMYGGGLDDAQIDIEGLKAWALWCDSKRLTFNYVLDARMNAAEVLQMIARSGRASLTYQTGKLSVVWDADNLPATAMYGPFNVKAGSFKVAYINDGSVDEVVLNFANEDNGWKMDEVRVRVPGSVSTNNSLQLDLDGCTNKDMAGREANLIAAAQVWKRRRISWEIDLEEGLLSTRGDVVEFTHDLTNWSYSSRMMPGSGGVTIKLQNEVPSNGTGIALLREPFGRMKTVDVSSDVGMVRELTILTPLDGDSDEEPFPMPGDPGYEDIVAFDWAVQFDPITSPGRRFKITGVTPSGGNGLKFEAVDDDPEYYLSENDPYQYTPPRDGALLAGVVLGITATESIVSVAADQMRVRFSWTLTSDADTLVALSINGVAQESRILSAREFEVSARTNDVLEITVTPRRIGSAGQPVRFSYTVRGLASPLPPVTGLQSIYRDGLTWLTWQRVVDLRQPGYEIRLGSSWADSQVVATTVATEQVAVGNGLYWVAARFSLASGQVIYGPASSILIAGAILERNVILVRQEAPEWDGTLTGGAVVIDGELTLAPQGDILAAPDVLSLPDVLWFGGPAAEGGYQIAEASRIDIGFVAPVRIGLDLDVVVRNLTADILSVPDILSLADVLNGSDRQHIKAQVQVRFAQVEDEWSEWADYSPGLINARYFDVRLLLETDDPVIVPFVRSFEWTIDVPDLIQRAEGVDVPAEGLAVVYAKRFHAVPNVQITLIDAEADDQIVLTDSDEDGFFVQIMSGVTPVARSVNWISQGY